MRDRDELRGAEGGEKSPGKPGAKARVPHADVILASALVAIVAMLIVPLPPLLLDVFICFNIAVAALLLLTSIYVSEALRIAAFPALLLITTLFRLAIEVSATRSILVRADAGDVIRAFGDFVVAGNLVAGVVIFFILTVVQFVVVAKGAERVAEVGARFTLDAMPGKQMAIDAELRAGHIDQAEARRRRLWLGREAQFFGAMDGAMKFVKGDAIAGIVILLTNILGGLAIGVGQRGMDLGQAAHTYTLLTVGEGLVAQIPALMISTAAGILVTRVSSDDGGDLGGDIMAQVLGYPRAMAGAAVLMLLLALVPGLPKVPFLLLSGGLAFVAHRARKTKPETQPAPERGPRGGRDARRGGATELPAPLLTPIVIELSDVLARRLAADDDGEVFVQETVSGLRAQLFADTGLWLPAVRVRAGVPGLGHDEYALALNEVRMGRGRIEGEAPAARVIGTHLLSLMRRFGHEFLGVEEAQALLNALERTHPTLVREVVPRLVTPVLLADVLRRLAEEGVSVRAMPEILGALSEWAPLERDPVALTEHVRAALRRQISQRHLDTDGTLGVYLLDALIEDTIRQSIQRTPTGSYLALEPTLSRDVLAAVGRTIPASSQANVILTSAEIRRFVRRLIEAEHPRVAVLSYHELPTEVRLRPLGRVTV